MKQPPRLDENSVRSPMADVFHYRIVEHDPLLAGRRQGAEVAAAVTREIRPRRVLLLSFRGVRVASLPFLDELIGHIGLELVKCPSGMLATCGMSITVRQHVGTVLASRDMVLANLSRRGLTLIGATGGMRELMRTAQKLEPQFSIDDLSTGLRQDNASMNDDLRRLIEFGVLGSGPKRQLHKPAQSDLERYLG